MQFLYMYIADNYKLHFHCILKINNSKKSIETWAIIYDIGSEI